jgi:hypothetical protein
MQNLINTAEILKNLTVEHRKQRAVVIFHRIFVIKVQRLLMNCSTKLSGFSMKVSRHKEFLVDQRNWSFLSGAFWWNS